MQPVEGEQQVSGINSLQVRSIAIVRVTVGLLLALVLGTPLASVNTQIRSEVKLINDFESLGIRLIGPADEMFDEEIRRYIGAEHKKLGPLLDVVDSLGVLVKSESQRPILGISLRWEFVNENGKVTYYPQSVSAPGELMGMVPLDPSLRGKTSPFHGSNLRFFTLLQNVESVFVLSAQNLVFPATNYKIDDVGIIKKVTLGNVEKESLRKSAGMCKSVAIDGILFNDGTFVGESKTGYFESISGSISATRDFLQGLRVAASEPNGLSQAIPRFANEEISSPNLVAGSLLDDKYQVSYISTMKSIRDRIRRQRAAGVKDIDIAEKEFLKRYTDFIPLKRI